MDAEKGSTEKEATVEYGGLVWTPSGIEGVVDFRTTQPDCGKYRICQYTDDGHYQGCWHWHVDFISLIGPALKPSVLKMETGGIKDTRDEAIQACLDAKGNFIEDIKLLSMALGVGNYPTGFMDGQSALSKKIAEVLP